MDAKIEKLTMEIQSNKRRNDNMVSDLKNQILKLENENRDLENKLLSTESENRRLTSNVNEKTRTVENVQKELDSLRNQLGNSTNDIRIVELKEQINANEREIKSKNEAIRKLRNSIEDQENDIRRRIEDAVRDTEDTVSKDLNERFLISIKKIKQDYKNKLDLANDKIERLKEELKRNNYRTPQQSIYYPDNQSSPIYAISNTYPQQLPPVPIQSQQIMPQPLQTQISQQLQPQISQQSHISQQPLQNQQILPIPNQTPYNNVTQISV